MTSLFFIIILLAFYTYIGYPIFLLLFSRVKAHQIDEYFRPTVTLLVAAYNEISVIEEKMKNSLELDYPIDKINFVFVSDGSDDGTTEYLYKYNNARMKVVSIFPRGGKAGALSRGIGSSSGEIIVLTDANTMIEKDAIKKLVRHFSSLEVGGVTGDVRIRKGKGGFGESEGMYYRIERMIQEKESDTDSVIGADGALYAIRKKLFILQDDAVILDDFVISMNIVKSGSRVLYDPEALAYENPTPEILQEMRRKSRVVAGGFQAIMRYHVMPTIKTPWLLFYFISHKLFRWIMPLLLIILIFLNIYIVEIRENIIYYVLLAGQIIFYVIASFGWIFYSRLTNKIFSIPFYFTMVNISGLWGMYKYFASKQTVVWKKATRI